MCNTSQTLEYRSYMHKTKREKDRLTAKTRTCSIDSNALMKAKHNLSRRRDGGAVITTPIFIHFQHTHSLHILIQLSKRVSSLVSESYSKFPQNTHFKLPIDSEYLTEEQAITVVASLADEGGSMLALSFFHWAIGYVKFRHFIRLYIVLAICLIKNENFERAHEVMHLMLRNFGEIGMLKEAVDMVFQMQNQGLVLNARSLSSVVSVTNEMGHVEMVEKVFGEMCERGVFGESFD